MTDIFDLDTLREDYEMEFKKALGKDGQGKVPESFWESYSSMANTEGGFIVLGVAEEKGSLNFVGIPDREKVIKELWDNLNNRQKISSNLLVNKDIRKETAHGVNIIVVQVPQATRKQKPIYVGANPLTGTYRRNNEGDYKCPEDIVNQMLGEKVNDTNDSLLLEGFSLKDVSGETLKIYRQNFSNRKPMHPFNDCSDEDFMRQIGGFSVDRKINKSGLTLAGLLMFGKLRSILDAVPNYILDYQEKSEAQTGKRWLDRVTTDFEWSGNLYDFYRIVIKKLTEGLKIPFELEGDKRIEDTPVHEALREALVNTLIHADYSARCSILVVKRADIFGFRNPGLLRMPIIDALRGGTSDCRNRNLQKMFQLIGFGEQAGSGLPKIYRNWKQQNWRKPLFEQKFDTHQTVMVLKMLSLFPEEAIAQVKKQIGEKAFALLNETEQLAIVFAKTDTSLSHSRLKELTNVHPKDLTDILHGLVGQGLLESDGRGRGTVYYLPGENPSQDVLNPEMSSESSEHLPESSEHLPESSEHLKKLQIIAGPVSKLSKAPKKLVEEVILNLCNNRYLSLKEIAGLLGREPDSIRNHYLNPLIDKGLIDLYMKNQKNHPKQKYTTVKKRKG